MTGYRTLGGGGGDAAVNFPGEIDAGLAHTTTLRQNNLPELEAGFAVQQADPTLLTTPDVGVRMDQRASGARQYELETGLLQESVLTMQTPPLSENGVKTEYFIDYTGIRYGQQASNQGADNWTNPDNAEDAPDGNSATISGQAVSATNGILRITVFNATGKDDLTIDKVELAFYVAQSGTTLNNGGLTLEWRPKNSGPWTTLATYTDDQDFLTVPAVFDITSGIATWDDIRGAQVRVVFSVAAGTALVNAEAESIEQRIEASFSEF